MPRVSHERRRKKVARALRKCGADALLVTNFTNVTYLTGFTGDDSYLIVGRDRSVLLSDSRYETQIAEECPGLDAVIRTNRRRLTEVTGDVLKKWKIGKLAIEARSITVETCEALREAVKPLELVQTSGIVESLREIKDAYEIAALRNAIQLAERGFDVLRASLRPEQSECEVAHDLEHTMRRFGALGVSFDPIVAADARAALPHANPTDTPLNGCSFVLVDWGATGPEGYRSDLTRVLCTGKILPKLEKIYEVVLQAQLRAIQSIGPGVACSDVDRAARQVIEKAGYGRKFGHGLGHGIGLEIHEGPRLSPTSSDVLKPGMVVTVEPGIYFPKWGGVRIEDDVLVTRHGCEVLTHVDKEFPLIASGWPVS
jgi:Xaa-Pro aminopeptidase